MKDYDYPRAQSDLARGVAPAVVALRLGLSEEAVLELADSMGWPIVHNSNRSPDVAARLEA